MYLSIATGTNPLKPLTVELSNSQTLEPLMQTYPNLGYPNLG